MLDCKVINKFHDRHKLPVIFFHNFLSIHQYNTLYYFTITTPPSDCKTTETDDDFFIFSVSF